MFYHNVILIFCMLFFMLILSYRYWFNHGLIWWVLGLPSIEPCRPIIVCVKGRTKWSQKCQPWQSYHRGSLTLMFEQIFNQCYFSLVGRLLVFHIIRVRFVETFPLEVQEHNTCLRPSWPYSWSNWPAAGTMCSNFLCPIMHRNPPGLAEVKKQVVFNK